MVEYEILGSLEVRQPDGATVSMTAAQRLILTVLLFASGGVVSADRLTEELWGERQPENPARALRNQVSRLRRLLGPAGSDLVASAGGYRLRVASSQVDAARFEELIAAARRRGGEGAVELLARALAVWRGPALGEFAGRSFAQPEVVRLEELRLLVREERADLLLSLGRVDEAVMTLEGLVAERPERERARASLMEALYRQGRHTDAIATYQAWRRYLADEFGLDPSPALQRLEGDILRHTMLPDPVPEGRSDPALGLPGNSFVGRETELDDLAGRLGHSRLVTLTGSGGVGKTRLAFHTIERVAERYPDGVYVCELARLSDSDGVALSVASALGLGERADRTVEERLLEFLRGKRALLVVDNCEHLLAGVAPLISAVLAHTPHVAVLATSRQRLGVVGEQRYPVHPLPVPTEDDVGGPAVELFVDRAAAMQPMFALTSVNRTAIGRLCRYLDGVPLAIELAAARVVARAPDEILAEVSGRLGRLADRRRVVDRHRSMDAVIAWSYDLMEPAEQLLFEQLAVFAGGFTAEAVAGMTGTDLESVLDCLTALTEHSLVDTRETGGRTRFVMLEPIRQHAEARLGERGVLERIRADHSGWFVRWAETLDVGLEGPEQLAWQAAAEQEFANLRAAHRWCLRPTGDADGAVRLASALHHWVQVLGAPYEVFTWVDETVARFAATGHPKLPRALAVASIGSWYKGDLTRARALAEQSISLASPDQPAEARWGWIALWMTDLLDGNPGRAADGADRAIALSRQAGDTYLLTYVRAARALALGYAGEREQACLELESARSSLGPHTSPFWRSYYDYVAGEIRLETDPREAQPFLLRSLDTARRVGNHTMRALAGLSALSCAARLGDPVDLGDLAELIDHWQRIGSWSQQWITVRNLVEMLTRLGRDEAAAVLHGALIGRESAPPIFGADADRMAQTEVTLRARLGDERFTRLQADGRALTDEDTIAFALKTVHGG